MLAFTIQYSLIFRRNCLFYYRPLKTHGFAVRLTVSRTISRSHDEAQKSHGKVKQSQADGIHFSNIPFLPRKNWFPGVNSVEIHSSKAYSSYLIVLLTGYGPQKPSKPYLKLKDKCSCKCQIRLSLPVCRIQYRFISKWRETINIHRAKTKFKQNGGKAPRPPQLGGR